MFLVFWDISLFICHYFLIIDFAASNALVIEIKIGIGLVFSTSSILFSSLISNISLLFIKKIWNRVIFNSLLNILFKFCTFTLLIFYSLGSYLTFIHSSGIPCIPTALLFYIFASPFSVCPVYWMLLLKFLELVVHYCLAAFCCNSNIFLLSFMLIEIFHVLLSFNNVFLIFVF